MKVLVDTSIWSLVLRRSSQVFPEVVHEFRDLIRDHRVQMLGPIRQEILSGVRDPNQFSKLTKHLQSFPDFPLLSEDYVQAANLFNLCRAKGVQGANTDFLICAVSIRAEFAIYSADKDFQLFAKYIPIMLHREKF